jgi:uncharacterized membrane protein
MRRLIKRFARDRRAAVAILMSLLLCIILVMTACAVDLGFVYLKSRALQGTADLAALAAANDLDHAQAAVQAVAADNGGEAASVTTGVYDPAAGASPQTRFSATAVADSNAAHVVMRDQADLFFGRLFYHHPITLTRAATASSVKMAAFSLGTRLASLDGGIANALLSGLTGSQISLSVMDYNALASGQIDLLSYVQALHTQAGLTAGSFDQTLNSEITVGQALDVLIGQSSTSVKAPLTLIADSAVRTTKIRLGDLIDAGVYGDQDHIVGGVDSAIQVSDMAMLNALLQLANQDRQVSLDLGASVPGLAGLKVLLAIGERPNHSPWLTVTRSGEPIIRTAQARLYIEASVASNNALLKPLGVTGLRLPVYVELASAEAKLSAIGCDRTSPANDYVGLLVKPSLGQVAIADINVNALGDFKTAETLSPAKLIGLPLIAATAQAQVSLGGESWQSVRFSAADISAQTVKTVKTNDLVQGVVASLVSQTQIKVSVAGLGLNLGGLTSAVGSLLSPVAPALDAVLDNLLDVLGLGLGEADAQVNGLRCQGAVLVG